MRRRCDGSDVEGENENSAITKAARNPEARPSGKFPASLDRAGPEEQSAMSSGPGSIGEETRPTQPPSRLDIISKTSDLETRINYVNPMIPKDKLIWVMNLKNITLWNSIVPSRSPPRNCV